MTKEEYLQDIQNRLAAGDESLDAIQTCIAYAAKIAPVTALSAVEKMVKIYNVVDVANDIEDYIGVEHIDELNQVNWLAVAKDEGKRLTAAINAMHE